MQELANSFVDSTVQCWACPVFDNLFVIISNTAAAAYFRLSVFSVIIFSILLCFYIFNVVMQTSGISNIFAIIGLQKSDSKSSGSYIKTLQPFIIKSLLVLTLLGAGLIVPRLISQITFEPAAILTLQYSKAMLLTTDVNIANYTAIPLDDTGFFNPALRDTILQLLQTSVSNFQVYIKIGIGIIEKAFTVEALFGIGSLIRHIIICFIGIFLTYNFAKLFIKYSFCFMDIIFAMAMFAFFFPISLVLFAFKDASALPEWMKKLGGDLGSGQIKKLINAIVSVASAIMTYTVIMVIIKGFLDANGVDTTLLQSNPGELFDFDLENSSAMQITFVGSIVLVYVINYIADQIPQITKKIMDVFGVSQEDKLSKEMGENALALTGIVWDNTKKIFNAIANPESASDKKEEKKEEKKDDKK